MNRCKTCKHHYRVVGDGITTRKRIENDSCEMIVDNLDNQHEDKVYYSEWINVPDEFGCIHHEEFDIINNTDTSIEPAMGDLVTSVKSLNPFIVNRDWLSLIKKKNQLKDYGVLIKANNVTLPGDL